MRKNIILFCILAVLLVGCDNQTQTKQDVIEEKINAQIEKDTLETNKNANRSDDKKEKIVFLHHSTGEIIWNAGVDTDLEDYHTTVKWYPENSDNMPYDYWNIWVNRGTSEIPIGELTDNYDLIVFKHCYPVSYIEAEDGSENIGSEKKTLSSYKLQYNALKEEMKKYPDTRFLVWTGATLIESETDQAHAQRAQQFFDWVINDWDVAGDNIYVWDFYNLQTEGGLYFRDSYSAGDSHPNADFAVMVATDLSLKIMKIMNEE